VEVRLQQARRVMDTSRKFMEKLEMGKRFLQQFLVFGEAASEVKSYFVSWRFLV
jgi:hypothetical protein